MITASQLKELSPSLSEWICQMWAAQLSKGMEAQEINTPARVQQYIATVMHESLALRSLEENLNYSAERLLQVFKKYFNAGNVHLYARQKEKIANRVYANRMGNGPESSGDGWKYRGRSPIHATGRDMYAALGEELFPSDPMIFVKNPDLLLKPDYGAPAACWIWKMKGCNHFADLGNFELSTKAINGGLNGLSDRYLWLAKCEKVLA